MRAILAGFLWLLLGLGPTSALADTAGTTPAAPALEPSAGELRAFADLLRDPKIQAWVQAQAAASSSSSGAAGTATTTPAPAAEAATTQQLLAGQLTAVRAFLGDLTAALPTIPAELSHAWLILYLEFEDRGLLSVLVLILTFVGTGIGLEWLFWWATTGFRRRMIASPLETVNDRLHAVGLRLAYGIGVLAAFAVGSVGAFLLFHWPPLLEEIVLGYLTIVLEVRLTLIAARILLAPGAERFRVVPMSTPAATFWFVWSAILVGWFSFIGVTLQILTTLGIAPAAGYALGIVGGFLLLGMTLFTVWRTPPLGAGAEAPHASRLGRGLLTVYLAAVWLALLAGTTKLFFVGIMLLLLPLALIGANRSVNHLLRPPGSTAAADAMPTITTVCLERGLRALLLIGGAYSIVWILGINLGEITTRDTLAARLIAGLINALVIGLAAEFLWHLLKTWIDRKLLQAKDPHLPDSEEERKRSRMRTLLPIFRNILLITLVVMAALMAMAAMGIEIGPLVAGAGVVGVAVGFGAQTLVKDIISGMFYLLDDAFRVGEYIQSGSYKGTVESFSLRSIKLRHHRGPLYTVPFGELGAVQNMSRDWVIDKLSVNLTYDTDLDKVKKVIKQIGRELAEDPEFAPHILDTLKMQGVEQMGDFAILIRMKMMTKPGEQFVIRRRAYAMMKKAFAAAGIRFAHPTVTVAGGGSGDAAASAAAKEILDPRPMAEVS
jgi:small-conductance mechanosensitive channel